jgi:hypothetical protein
MIHPSRASRLSPHRAPPRLSPARSRVSLPLAPASHASTVRRPRAALARSPTLKPTTTTPSTRSSAPRDARLAFERRRDGPNARLAYRRSNASARDDRCRAPSSATHRRHRRRFPNRPVDGLSRRGGRMMEISTLQ